VQRPSHSIVLDANLKELGSAVGIICINRMILNEDAAMSSERSAIATSLFPFLAPVAAGKQVVVPKLCR
jgi:hypothetical protein